MLTSTRKPGPPVPPRPSAAAVANALAKHREKSPSQQQQQISGVHTLKPPHPGRTVVYKSPAFDQVKKPQSSDPKELVTSKTEVYVGESHGYNNVPRPVLPPPPPATTISTNNSSSLENGKLMYTSTCSIIEINSSSSASTSASSSPVSTLQKTDSKTTTNLLGIVGGRTADHHRNHFNSADDEEDEDTSICQKQLKNTYNHRHHQHHLLDPLDNSGEDLIAIKRNSPDVIVINSASEHDSGTEHNSMDTNSIASSNSLERENNLKNLESRTAHMTEIIIGSDGSDVVTNTNIVEATNHVIRSSSIRLPYRPEPEGGEHVIPSNDSNTTKKTTQPPAIDPSTLNSKLNEKKVAFHELLISELTAMRSAAANRRQRKPPENRPSPEISPTGTARIRTADWIEVGDNGKEVVLSSCQISLEDSGLEDEGGKHDEEERDDDGGSSGVGDSWDSVKDAEERITMSLPGLPPLPKSLSGFDLAGQQLQAHQQHHQQQHQNHHHHQQHHPPQHQPPAPPQQQHQQHQHQQHLQPPQQHQQQQQSPLPHPQQGLPPSLNHHPTNPFIPIGVNLQSVSMASLVSQRGQSPVSSTVSSSSMAATPNSGSGSGGGGGTTSQQAAVRKPTTLDTQLAILRREMYGLRQLDLSLLSQLWALNESIQEFRTMLQEQETLSPPSPTPSNSDANSVSSDDDEDDSSNTQTVGAGAGGLLTNHHNLIESVAAASVLSSAAQTASSRMRAPPPPPPNRKAPSRPV